MITVRLQFMGGTVTHESWTDWEVKKGGELLLYDGNEVTCTFARGAWSHVHNLDPAPILTLPTPPPMPIYPPHDF